MSVADVTKQFRKEERATHADGAVNAPLWGDDPGFTQDFVPHPDVMVDAVNQSAVEVKDDARLAHRRASTVAAG
jgi:hypothetical protein